MDAEANIFFNDPRLVMSVAGRLLVRIVNWIAYLVLIAATFTFLISGITRVRFIGVFLGLMLLDFLIHRSEGDARISELPKEDGVEKMAIATTTTTTTKTNVAKFFRPTAFAALERAFDASLLANRNFFLEMTARLLEFPEIEGALQRLDVPVKEFKQKLDEFATEKAGVGYKADGTQIAPTTRDEYLKQVELLAVGAFGQAVAGAHDFVGLGDLFSALPGVGDESINRLFTLFSITASDIERALIFSSASTALRGALGGLPGALGGFSFDMHRRAPHRIMNRAWTSRPTPMLDRYSTDFTDLARGGSIGFLVGHEDEYALLAETLGRSTNPNALLVGEPGIGKEAIVQHLAFRLTKDDVPPALFDKRLVALALQDLIVGAAMPDELNKLLKAIVEEIYLAGNIILYIPDIHNLVKTSGGSGAGGSSAYLSAADALMPVVKSNAFPIIGATYPKEFKQSVEPRTDFTGAFEIIRVNEITEAEAEKVLAYEALILEKKSRVTVSFGAVKRAVSLARKYFHTKFLPSSAEELLKGAIGEAERRGEKVITPDLVTAVAETKSSVPMHEAAGAEAEQLLNMEDIIHKRLIDQEEAVKAVATALREYRSGLARKGGPIASFLFVGPTGVGKTELAKILADIQFGSPSRRLSASDNLRLGSANMTRFDMTEYQDKASFVRFIGSPDGQTRGALTDAVLEKPYSLILLDEFEKAFPDILDLFLQVLDDGRLTDGLGRTVDFTNTIIIATSNAHSDIINEALAKGQAMDDVADELKKRLTDVFKPELINRFSKIIIFKNLKPAELAQIVAFNLQELAASLKEQDIDIEFAPEAVAEIARLGYDPAFGARPLRRVIEEKIRAPLSEAILGKKVVKGGRVKMVFNDGTFGFE